MAPKRVSSAELVCVRYILQSHMPHALHDVRADSGQVFAMRDYIIALEVALVAA